MIDTAALTVTSKSSLRDTVVDNGEGVHRKSLSITVNSIFPASHSCLFNPGHTAVAETDGATLHQRWPAWRVAPDPGTADHGWEHRPGAAAGTDNTLMVVMEECSFVLTIVSHVRGVVPREEIREDTPWKWMREIGVRCFRWVTCRKGRLVQWSLHCKLFPMDLAANFSICASYVSLYIGTFQGFSSGMGWELFQNLIYCRGAVFDLCLRGHYVLKSNCYSMWIIWIMKYTPLKQWKP